MTIAQRTTIDLWRRPSSRPFLQEPPETGLEDPRFDRLLTAVTVRDALDALSPAHREVRELCFTEDLSRDQVAERVGVPVGTVKTRLYYGLRGGRRKGAPQPVRPARGRTTAANRRLRPSLRIEDVSRSRGVHRSDQFILSPRQAQMSRWSRGCRCRWFDAQGR